LTETQPQTRVKHAELPKQNHKKHFISLLSK